MKSVISLQCFIRLAINLKVSLDCNDLLGFKYWNLSQACEVWVLTGVPDHHLVITPEWLPVSSSSSFLSPILRLVITLTSIFSHSDDSGKTSPRKTTSRLEYSTVVVLNLLNWFRIWFYSNWKETGMEHLKILHGLVKIFLKLWRGGLKIYPLWLPFSIVYICTCAHVHTCIIGPSNQRSKLR